MMIYGNIVEEDGLKPGVLEFDDGLITNLIREPRDPRNDLHDEYGSFIDRYFTRDKYIIFPGFVDLGAMCCFATETYASSAIAALNGGITALADISIDPVTTESAIEIVHIRPNYIIVSSQSEPNADKTAVTPFHLLFTSEMARKLSYLKSSPPLPTLADQEMTIEHLNVIDYLISGHVPVTALDKMNNDVPGFPGLDTYGSFVSWLINNKGIDPTTIFNIACKNPGRIFEEETGRKVGRLTAGSEASFTILNITKSAEHGRSIMSKSGWSPFDLRNLTGYVDVVYYKGEKMVDGPWMYNFTKTF